MPSITEAVCPICNGKFVKKEKEQKYCSLECAYRSPERRRNVSLALKGKNKWTEERKREHGNCVKALWQDSGYRERIMKTMSSPDYRQRLSEIHKKIPKPWFKPPPLTEELKTKIKEGQIRYWTKERRKERSLNNPAKRPEIRLKISEELKQFYKNNPEFMKKLANAPQGRKKRSENAKKQWKTKREIMIEALLNASQRPEVKQNRSKSRKEVYRQHPELIEKIIASGRKKPNSLEKWFIDFFQRNKFPIEYIGDGKLILHTPSGWYNPDFRIIGTNKVIEVGSPPWHSEEDFKKRVEALKSIGFECKTFFIKNYSRSAFVKLREQVLSQVSRFIAT